MFAHRSFLDAGITVAGSSDYPCGPFQPLFGIQSMVTRRGADDGTLVGGGQRITAAEALEVFTIGSAAAAGQESYLGRLQPGYLADFVVPGENPEDEMPERSGHVPDFVDTQDAAGSARRPASPGPRGVLVVRIGR